MNERNTARTMIQQLQNEFNETLNTLYDLPEDYLQQSCGHACARGGTARDLLVHNIFHEKQHTGQVWNIRDELRLLQGWGNASLYPLLVDYYLSRAQLISSEFGLTDAHLDTPRRKAAGRFGKLSSMRSAANAAPSAHSETSSKTAPAPDRVAWRDVGLAAHSRKRAGVFRRGQLTLMNEWPMLSLETMAAKAMGEAPASGDLVRLRVSSLHAWSE